MGNLCAGSPPLSVILVERVYLQVSIPSTLRQSHTTMFFKSYLLFLLISAFVANAAVIAVRKQDDATTSLQFNKLKDSGLLDKFDKNDLDKQIKGMSATDALKKIVASDRFKELKSRFPFLLLVLPAHLDL